MAAGGGDLGAAAGHRLSPDLAEVQRREIPLRDGVGGRGLDGAASEDVGDGVSEVMNRDDPHAFDRGRLGGVGRRKHDLAEPRVARGQSEAQGPAHGSDLAAEAELADEDASGDLGRTGATQPEESHRDRKVERGAALAEVGRSQVDGDRAFRHGESAVFQRRADALPGLAHAGVGEADDGEARKAARDVHFDVENTRLQTQGRSGVDAGEHEASSGPRRA